MDQTLAVEARAAELLRELSGPNAEFRDGQLEAIRALAEDRGRVLVVQRTGWGKSAVYLITTKILREAGLGPTILISPLLSLMRNQMAMASRLDVKAATINSSNPDQWEQVADDFVSDRIDLLLVSPERFANPRFQSEFMPLIARRTGLIVIDEVHCISDWGHDFRPDYRRVRHILDLLPDGVPVVGTTATANDRVVGDVTEQLGTDLVLHRGGLARSGLRLQAVPMPVAGERLAWLVGALGRLPGTGIVYCLTIKDAERVAEWLNLNNIDAVAYSGAEDPEVRERVEEDLLQNRVKVVVATSALGMGFDKPDLAFVIHYQSPGSPIAYYQQVGRAGRALDESFGILLAGVEDSDIQDWFIKTAFPSREIAEQVIDIMQTSVVVSRSALEAQINLGRTRLDQMLKVLEVEGAIERVKGGYRRTEAPWTYPAERVAGITAARRREQKVMAEYKVYAGCLMQFLGQELDDPETRPCGICMNCAGAGLQVQVDPALAARATEFLRSRILEIEPRRQWPPGTAEKRSGRIPAEHLLETGRALAEMGDGGWAGLVHRGREQDGVFSDALVDAAAALIGNWSLQPAPQWLTYVPSTGASPVAKLAERLAKALDLPLHHPIAKVAQNRPQSEMLNSAQQFSNVARAFAVDSKIPKGPVLLVDDLVESRWTMTMVGVLLREAGSGPVYPFALAARPG